MFEVGSILYVTYLEFRTGPFRIFDVDKVTFGAYYEGKKLGHKNNHFGYNTTVPYYFNRKDKHYIYEFEPTSIKTQDDFVKLLERLYDT